MGIRKNFSKNLRQLMRDRRVTQIMLAEHVGVKQGSVSGWITKGDFPMPETVDKIAEFFGIAAHKLFLDPPDKPVVKRADDELMDVIKMTAKKEGFKIKKG